LDAMDMQTFILETVERANYHLQNKLPLNVNTQIDKANCRTNFRIIYGFLVAQSAVGGRVKPHAIPKEYVKGCMKLSPR
jgi:hypothetical protein